jgi:hypothetical protein
MKQTHFVIAVGALAVMVFAITFATTYLGAGKQTFEPSVTNPSADSDKKLTFRTKVIPEVLNPETAPPLAKVIEMESKPEGGSGTFWFINDTGSELPVGLRLRGCTCSNVAIFVQPKTPWKELAYLLATESAAPVFHGPDLFRALSARAAAQEILKSVTQEEYFKLDKDRAPDMPNAQESVTVPAGAVGWVRLAWKGEKSGNFLAHSTLWFGKPDGGATERLEIHTLFRPVLRGPADVDAGSFSESELDGESGRQLSILVWSSTRPTVNLKAEVPGTPPEKSPFLVGKPEKLNEKETRALEQIHNTPKSDPSLAGKVLCAYRIPVIIRKVSQDGKVPFELGVFRRQFTISSPDEGVHPMEVTVHGRIHGSVALLGDYEGGMVSMTQFKSSAGSSRSIQLRSEDDRTTLTFDRERTPKFLSAKFVDKPIDRDGQRIWKIMVEVGKGLATGPFPRPEGEYRDSAIYLKASQPDKTPRTIRIPVIGTATNDTSPF